MLRGALAASVTPLRDGGDALDEDAFGPVVDFLAAGGLDGLLAMGTNGEGILLSTDERRSAAERFVEASAGRLQVAVHCGAQTTADTVALAAHAAEAGADAVAVIAPPYFALDDVALLAHFAAAAAACAPLPFYVYEFERTSGYAVPPHVDRSPARAGAEPRRPEGLRPPVGQVRAVSDRGPRRLRRAGVADRPGPGRPEPWAPSRRSRRPSPSWSSPAVRGDGEDVDVGGLRELIERFPRHAALKHVLVRRGVPISEDVRGPLRALTDGERNGLDAELTAWLPAA